MTMFLIVGLGNPGKKYQNTRHNIGFMAADEIVANFEFTSWQTIFNAQISKGTLNNQRVILIKPQTFMNLSGKSVSKIARFYKIKPENVIVVHDDIDLPLGAIRIVKNRGAAGHKGVESIIKELGKKNFIRFRIGINPGEKLKAKFDETKASSRASAKASANKKQLERFVLQKFTKEEGKVTKEIIKKTLEAIELTIKEGSEKAQNAYNK